MDLALDPGSRLTSLRPESQFTQLYNGDDNNSYLTDL